MEELSKIQWSFKFCVISYCTKKVLTRLVNLSVMADKWINSAGKLLPPKQEIWHASVSIGLTLDLHWKLTEPAAWGRAQLCLCDCVCNLGSPEAVSDIPVTANSAWTLTLVLWKLWWCSETHFSSDHENRWCCWLRPEKLTVHNCLLNIWYSVGFGGIVCGHHITLKPYNQTYMYNNGQQSWNTASQVKMDSVHGATE